MDLTNIIEKGVVGAHQEGKAIEAEEKNSAGYDNKMSILNRTSGAAGKRAAEDFRDFKGMIQAKANLDKLADTQEINRSEHAKRQVEIQQNEQKIALAIATKAMFLRMKETKAYSEEFRKLYQQDFGKSVKETFAEDFGTNHGLSDGALADAQESMRQQRLLLQESKARRIEDLRSLPGAQFDQQAETASAGTSNTPEEKSQAESSDSKKISDAQTKTASQPDEDVSNVIPESVLRKYVVVDNRYYENGKEEKLAFVDGTTKISASDGTPDDHHVRSMVDIAEARKWPSIKVSGTKEFRATVWLEASLRGIKVDGYVPSDIEKARLAAVLAKRDKTHPESRVDNSIERGPMQKAQKNKSESNTAKVSSKQGVVSNDQPQSYNQDTNSSKAKSEPKVRTYVGKLVEHGPALYKFDKDESPSYFAKIETIKGVETIWGKDIQFAMSEANAKIGEEIKLQHTGQKPVVVDANVRNEEGKVVGVEPIDTNRNNWKVERLEAAAQPVDDSLSRKEKLLKAFDSDPSILEAAKRHPELPELTHAAAALLVTEKQLASKTDAERQALLNNAKANMRRDIEQDKGVPSVLVKENGNINLAGAKQSKKDSSTNKPTKTKQQELSQ
ncbi:LPD7 domain-containing protein [Undibacterium sp. SXout7W]|uniref:LPD7 domain-containing protein n=1 Tax=Undibacterium sp. SXout7W TaxID=3413049 RepID=UPI003BF16A82